MSAMPVVDAASGERGVIPAKRARADRRLALVGLVAVSCLLAAWYSIATPPFEAPDEPGHYAYVEWLVSGSGIPLQGQEPLPLQPEFSQPPLYYLMEAPFAWLGGRQPANLPEWEGHHNPFQNRTDYGNANLYLHSQAEAFPWGGAVLGLHLMRLANVVLLATLIVGTYGCALELGQGPLVAWLAAATVGLLPQVLFMGGVLNADNAIAALSALSLYLLLRWLNRGPNTGLGILLGLALGGAALSKLSGLVTLALGLGFMGLRTFRLKKGFADVAAAGGVAALLGGWWYLRNWAVLGDPIGWQAMLKSTGDMLRSPPLAFGSAALTLLQRWHTGLGAFGWTNVSLEPIVYRIGAILVAVGALGLVLRRWRGAHRPLAIQHWLLLIWPLAFVISLVRWVEVNTAADQWRLLFPAFPAISLLLAVGWAEVAGKHREALLAVPAGLFGLNLFALAFLIPPAYDFEGTYVGPIDHAANVRFGDSLQLVGYSQPQPMDSRMGDTVEVDLFWRNSAPIARDYATDIGIIDGQTRLTWKELSIPDEGRAPMSAWQPGTVVRDRHLIRVRPDMVGVQTLLLSVIDPEPPGNHLPAANGDIRLENDTLSVTRFMVLPASPPSPAVRDDAVFADHLRLVGHTFEVSSGQLKATLVWAAESGVPSKDYTVFGHLLASDGRQVAQHDGQPGGGAFPTSLLSSGVAVPDTHVLDVTGLPAGDYRLEVGLYQLASGERLATANGQGSVVLPLKLG